MAPTQCKSGSNRHVRFLAQAVERRGSAVERIVRLGGLNQEQERGDPWNVERIS
jgi:hypothetical protein